MSLTAGLDLCLFPAGTPPDGQLPNFENPPTYAPTVIGVSAVVLFFAALFTGCRLLANWKKLTWGDYLNALALVFSLGQTGIFLAQLKFVRHQWDIPACWLFGNYAKLVFSQQMMLMPGLILSKVSLFLLFQQIFDINRHMRLAIRVGIAFTMITYVPNIPIEAYFQAPAAGESWEAVMASEKPKKAAYWGLVQSSLGILLDFYMFILPLPAISKLHVSRKKRIQLWLVFSTAFMGVVANILSLAYRATQFMNMADATWNMYALLLCTVVELNIAIIVCSVPGLAKFCRTYVATWTVVQSLRSRLSKLGRSTTSGPSGSSPPEKHAWPAADHRTPNSLTDEEDGLKQPTSVSLHDSEMGRTHGDVQMREHWQVHSDMPEVHSDMPVFDPNLVDPYLDTAGPEYSWLHRSSHDNTVSEMGSPDNNSGFQSARGTQIDMGK